MYNPEILDILVTLDEDKQNFEKPICVGHHYAQTNTNEVNKIWALLQITGNDHRIIKNTIQ